MLSANLNVLRPQLRKVSTRWLWMWQVSTLCLLASWRLRGWPMETMLTCRLSSGVTWSTKPGCARHANRYPKTHVLNATSIFLGNASGCVLKGVESLAAACI